MLLFGLRPYYLRFRILMKTDPESRGLVAILILTKLFRKTVRLKPICVKTKLIPIILACCCLYYARAICQPVVFVNAGSRASWGTVQELWIDANGQCRYFVKEVNGPVKDSSSFMLAAGQLDAFFSQANQLGFFGLDKTYDGGALDGSGILFSLNDTGKKHLVQVRNMEVEAIRSLVDYLNGLLNPHRVVLNYGPAPKPR